MTRHTLEVSIGAYPGYTPNSGDQGVASELHAGAYPVQVCCLITDGTNPKDVAAHTCELLATDPLGVAHSFALTNPDPAVTGLKLMKTTAPGASPERQFNLSGTWQLQVNVAENSGEAWHTEIVNLEVLTPLTNP